MNKSELIQLQARVMVCEDLGELREIADSIGIERDKHWSKETLRRRILNRLNADFIEAANSEIPQSPATDARPSPQLSAEEATRRQRAERLVHTPARQTQKGPTGTQPLSEEEQSMSWAEADLIQLILDSHLSESQIVNTIRFVEIQVKTNKWQTVPDQRIDEIVAQAAAHSEVHRTEEARKERKKTDFLRGLGFKRD